MPQPNTAEDIIKLAHGAGGRLSHSLTRRLTAYLKNEWLAPLGDAAVLTLGTNRLAFTTDSHVIQPLFFPGGDIGRLAVFGTVNDLAVMGAKPLYLSCGLILEEGLLQSDLDRIVQSLAQAAQEAEVCIVTGDTKVVEHGKGDGVFINTAGIGVIASGADLCPDPLQPGDQILVTGTLGDHAAAIVTVREGLRFDSQLTSDCAPLSGLLGGLLKICRGVKWMRDPTRGGLAASLNELVERQPFGVEIEESAIPIKDAVRSICDLLGFDPLHLANEGKAVIMVRPNEADRALLHLRNHPLGREATRIGQVIEKPAGRVLLRTAIGGQRVLDMPAGELLPRIC